MMPKTDPAPMTPSQPSKPLPIDDDRPVFWPAVRAIGFSLLAVMALGALVGFVAAASEEGLEHSVAAYLAFFGILAVLVGSTWLAIRAVKALRAGPASPRTTKARKMLYLSMALGGVVGVVLQLGDTSSNAMIEGPLPPAIAVFAIAALLIGVPLVSWNWWRNIDEHEAQSYKDGALVGIYTYSAITPIWWFGWRGGFFPEPHAMIIFLIVTAVWGLTWAYRRYA
ncbi:MAG: hypothetical protein ACK4NZ_13880 [Tsuneonella sp.]